MNYTDEQLVYAAGARCSACGAGLAHPLDHEEALRVREWRCSGGLANLAGHISQPRLVRARNAGTRTGLTSHRDTEVTPVRP